jgi:hypothetical protein
MTRDKEYITEYLESNFYLIADRTFMYCNKVNEKTISETDVKQELLLVFGNFTGLGKIFFDWSNYHKNILIEGLIDYFDSLDLSLGSYELVNKISLEEKIFKNYKLEFIIGEFEKYYTIKKIDTLSLSIKEKLEETNLDYLNSNNLVSLFIHGSVKETSSITDKLELEINDWYYENIFKTKLDEFFSQCRLSLGLTNWVVRHPIYGSFDEKSVVSIFAGESVYQKSILRNRFDSWYEENIYGASEKAVLNLYL